MYKAIKVFPYDSISLNNRAGVKAALGDYDGAYVDVNKSIEINPNYVLGHLSRAQIGIDLALYNLNLKKSKQVKEYVERAIDDYNMVLASQPKQPLAREGLRKAKSILYELKKNKSE